MSDIPSGMPGSTPAADGLVPDRSGGPIGRATNGTK